MVNPEYYNPMIFLPLGAFLWLIVAWLFLVRPRILPKVNAFFVRRRAARRYRRNTSPSYTR